MPSSSIGGGPATASTDTGPPSETVNGDWNVGADAREAEACRTTVRRVRVLTSNPMAAAVVGHVTGSPPTSATRGGSAMRWTRIVVLAAVSLGLSTGTGARRPRRPLRAAAVRRRVHGPLLRRGRGARPDRLLRRGPAVRRVRQARHHRGQRRRGRVRARRAGPVRDRRDRSASTGSRTTGACSSRGRRPGRSRWDGSYWFDKGTGQAAGRLRHLTVGGQPMGVDQAARLVAPVSPELAAYLRSYGRGGDGIGDVGDAGVPLDPRCARWLARALPPPAAADRRGRPRWPIR